MKSNQVFSRFVFVCSLQLLGFGLFVSAVPRIEAVSSVDGQQYYLWGEPPTHGQPAGNTWDIGLMNETRPSTWTRRNCSVWVQYFFDEDDSYFGGYTFSSIYIRFWWSSYQNSEGIRFAYEVNGTYGGTAEGSWNVTSYVRLLYTNEGQSTSFHSDYRLSVLYVDFTDYILSDSDVYDFNIWFIALVSTEAAQGDIVSPPNDPSFVIINPPSNSTLQSQDTDNDGLTDYDEMYVYYTDPKSADTFGSGWTDTGDPIGSYASSYPWRRQEIYFNNSRRMQTLDFDGTQSNISYIRLNKYWYVMNATMKIASFLKPLDWTTATDTGNRGIAIGDVNNDGDNELLIGGVYGGVDVFDTSEWSSLFTTDIGREASTIVVGDLTSDAGNEFAVGSNEGVVNVYNSTFDNIWSEDLGAFSHGLAIADCDNDGKTELVASVQGKVTVWDSSFNSEQNITTFAHVWGLDVGDANNDGLTDIVFGGWNDMVKVYNSSGSYELIKQFQVLAGERSTRVKVADIDNDGQNEIVVAGSDGVEAYRLLGTNDPTKLWSSSYIEAGSDTFPECGFSVADLDGDGRFEILVSASGGQSRNATIYILDYEGSIIYRYNNPNQASGIAIGDVDNDGDSDLAFAFESTKVVRMHDSFPANVSVDVGDDGSDEFSGTYGLFSNMTFNIAGTLNDYLSSASGNWVNAPVNITSTGGTLGIYFDIIYTPFSTRNLDNTNNNLRTAGNPHIQNVTNGGITTLSYESDLLSFTVQGETATATFIEVDCSEKGGPLAVSGASSWGYNSETNIITIMVLHTSSKEIIVYFTEHNPPTTNISLSGVLGNNDWYISEVKVTLSAADDISGVDKTEYSFDNVTWTIYTTPFNITQEGNSFIYYKSTDKVGNVETTKNETMKIDKTAPSGSIIINNGDTYTTTISVMLTLTATDDASGIYQVRLSNDGVWDTEPWETPSPTKPWTLTSGDQTKTVYCQIKDNAGLISDIYSDTVLLDTTPPKAKAGNDQNVDEDSLAKFDASDSEDNNGIATYEWTFTDVAMQTLNGKNPTYNFASPGTYKVTLRVTDSAGNSATDTVTITVQDITKPVANAGSNRTVTEHIAITLDGGASSDNVGIVRYEWDFGDGTIGTGVISVHTYADPGTYTATLTVRDAAGNTDADTISVTVVATQTFPMWIIGAMTIIGVAILMAIFYKKHRG